MSKFIESLEKVKNGTATDEEMSMVQSEIQKHEAIEEYLEMQFQDTHIGELIVHDDNVIDTKKISRKIRLRLIRTVLIVLIVIALIIGGIIAIVNEKYYNPNDGIKPVYGGDGQLLLDMRVFSELHTPGYITNAAEAWRDGPGSYQLKIQQYDLFLGTTETIYERLVRGKISGKGENYVSDYLDLADVNTLSYAEWQRINLDEQENEQRYHSADDLGNQLNELKQLPVSSQAAVYVTLSSNISLEQFHELYSEWGDKIDFCYAAVKGTDGFIFPTVGFDPSGGVGIVMENVPDNFPYLQLTGRLDRLEVDVDIWEKHFNSLIEYMSERGPFIDAMASVASEEYYKEIADYIDANDMNIYGVLIHGNTKDVVSFIDQIEPYDFHVDNVSLSYLSRG